jgi:hypothetical protein
MIPYLFAWLPMLFLAVGNGIFREAILKKKMTTEKAHQVSTLLLVGLLVVYMVFFLLEFPPQSFSQAITIGAGWMLLTLLFEFGFGRYRGIPWQTMFAEYNLLKGKLWALVPASLLLVPVVFYFFTAN